MSRVAVEDEVFTADELRDFTSRVFKKLGMPKDEAILMADHLVWAELRGITWVGLKKVPQTMHRIRQGGTNPAAKMVVVDERPAFALVDGQNSFSGIVGVWAMDMAVERARTSGVGVVVMRNTTSANAMGYFAARAAAKQMIGLAINNSPPLMPAPGGTTKVIGTQAFAVAAPAGNQPPLVLDMATSATTLARMYAYLQKGEELPEDMVLTADGKPTVDAAAALEGMLLPMAGHRGYGLALMWEVLTGVLAGGPRFAGNVTMPDVHDTSQGVSMFFLAIDPEVAMPYDTFVSRVDELIAQIRTSAPARRPHHPAVPGERSYAVAAVRERDGIPVGRDLLGQLNEVGTELGIAGPWTRSPTS